MEDLSDEQIDEFRAVFDLFTEDGSDVLSIENLERVLKTCGREPSSKDLREVIRLVDPTGKGEISFEDFVLVMSKQIRHSDKEAELTEAFRAFDADRSGYISAHELRTVMTNMGAKMTEEEINGMISEIDIDGDGKINFEEFVRLVISHVHTSFIRKFCKCKTE